MKAEFWTGSLPIVARFLYVGYPSVSPMNMDVILPLSSESSGRLGASFFSSTLYPWCPGAGILLCFYIPGA